MSTTMTTTTTVMPTTMTFEGETCSGAEEDNTEGPQFLFTTSDGSKVTLTQDEATRLLAGD